MSTDDTAQFASVPDTRFPPQWTIEDIIRFSQDSGQSPQELLREIEDELSFIPIKPGVTTVCMSQLVLSAEKTPLCTTKTSRETRDESASLPNLETALCKSCRGPSVLPSISKVVLGCLMSRVYHHFPGTPQSSLAPFERLDAMIHSTVAARSQYAQTMAPLKALYTKLKDRFSDESYQGMPCLTSVLKTHMSMISSCTGTCGMPWKNWANDTEKRLCGQCRRFSENKRLIRDSIKTLAANIESAFASVDAISSEREVEDPRTILEDMTDYVNRMDGMLQS